MGHESAGEVIAVGDRVTTHKVGDRVAGELGGFSGSYWVGEGDADGRCL